jgi:hypothetical protein
MKVYRSLEIINANFPHSLGVGFIKNKSCILYK